MKLEGIDGTRITINGNDYFIQNTERYVRDFIEGLAAFALVSGKKVTAIKILRGNWTGAVIGLKDAKDIIENMMDYMRENDSEMKEFLAWRVLRQHADKAQESGVQDWVMDWRAEHIKR